MDPHTTAAQLYFPHYKLDAKRSEIGLHEYDLAAKALEADHRSLTVATGIVVFLISVVPSIAGTGSSAGGVLRSFDTAIGEEAAGWSLKVTILIAAVLAIHYFAGLQRSATYAARKIVVLRRLLGLDYGQVESVLPSDRLDGANEPYSIEMFPGWYSLPALPVIIVALAAGVAQTFAFIAFAGASDGFADGAPRDTIGMLAAHFLATLAICFVYFRLSLLDDFENLRLLLSKALSLVVGGGMKRNFGYVLYRLRLSVFEANRLGVDLYSFHDLLVAIEDRQYYRHNGNSVRAILAVMFRYLRRRRITGGSTIYQQLVRSNFLTDLSLLHRRKIFEWLLAPWLNRQFSKRDALNAYLCSVRFDKGVIGLPDAIRHFFPNHLVNSPLSSPQRFFLIERLSNVSGTYPKTRVATLAENMRQEGYLTQSEAAAIDQIYVALIERGLIRQQR